MIETKHVTDRRRLTFARLQDILDDVETLDHLPRRTTGNWTDAQIVEHVAMTMAASFDGFDITAPLVLRAIVRVMRGRLLARTLRAGIKLPENMRSMLPDAGVTWDDAVANVRRQAARAANGERMTVRSPVFGTLSHEQWVQLHCRHAELHLSFVQPA